MRRYMNEWCLGGIYSCRAERESWISRSDNITQRYPRLSVESGIKLYSFRKCLKHALHTWDLIWLLV